MGTYSEQLRRIAQIVGGDEDAVNNLYSTLLKAIENGISDLIDRMEAQSNIGRYLSTWDCTTGLPGTNPQTNPYTFVTGDYFVVSKVGETNYMPNGASYDGTASTTIDTSEVAVADMYRYDGTTWERLDFHLAVESKLDKTSIPKTIYANDSQGDPVSLSYDAGLTDNSVVMRNGSGRFDVNTPTSQFNAANKKYVDDRVTTHEAWTFTLEDDTTVTKEVCVWISQQ